MQPFDADAFKFVLPSLSGQTASFSVQVAIGTGASGASGEWATLASPESAPWAPDLSKLRWQRLDLVLRARAA